MTNKTTSAIDPARLLAWQGDMPEQLKDDLKRAADTITRLQAALTDALAVVLLEPNSPASMERRRECLERIHAALSSVGGE